MSEGQAALAVGTAGLVVAIYGAVMPTMAETRSQVDDSGHLAAGERYAAIVSGAVVLGIAGATGSAQAAAVGLVAVVGLAAAYRVATDHTP